MLNLSLRNLTRALLVAVVLFGATALKPSTAQAEQHSVFASSPITQEIEQDNSILPPLEQTEANAGNSTSLSQTPAVELKTSTVFMENVGQFDSRARFQVQSGDRTLYFSENVIWLTVMEPMEVELTSSEDKFSLPVESIPDSSSRKGVNIKINMTGANPHPEIAPFGKIETNYSFFWRGFPGRWIRGRAGVAGCPL